METDAIFSLTNANAEDLGCLSNISFQCLISLLRLSQDVFFNLLWVYFIILN